MARKSGNGYANIGRGDQKRSADLSDANAERFLDAVHRLTVIGDAIFISRTRNGSAIRVQVYSGDDKPEWYVGSADEFDQLMLELITYLDETTS